MPYVDILPGDSTAVGYSDETDSGTSGCVTHAGNALTDNGTNCLVQRNDGTGGVAVGACYNGVIELIWDDAGSLPDGVSINGIQFIFECKGNLYDLTDGVQYRVSTDGGSNYSSYQDADLTGMANNKASTLSVIAVPSSAAGNPPFGVSATLNKSGLETEQLKLRFKLNSLNPNTSRFNVDYVKARIHYAVSNPEIIK